MNLFLGQGQGAFLLAQIPFQILSSYRVCDPATVPNSHPPHEQSTKLNTPLSSNGFQILPTLAVFKKQKGTFSHEKAQTPSSPPVLHHHGNGPSMDNACGFGLIYHSYRVLGVILFMCDLSQTTDLIVVRQHRQPHACTLAQ